MDLGRALWARLSMSALGHVWTAPWQELSSRLQPWSVQPCVRPVRAAHARPLAIMPSADQVPARYKTLQAPCPLYPRKRHQMRQLECPLRATSGHGLIIRLSHQRSVGDAAVITAPVYARDI